MADEEKCTCVAIDTRDHTAVVNFCVTHVIGLVVIGPEGPLVDGLADSLRAAHITVFGPSAQAAQLEGSKGFTKDLCTRAHIPTAAYVRCEHCDIAHAQLDNFIPPYVIKADGLAAGKGVVIAETREAAAAAIDDMFSGGLGEAGTSVVIEEFLTGEEVSFFALTDGSSVVSFGSAQDHKRVGEGDSGPNTGGMGAYSPASVFTSEIEINVLEDIVKPTVKAMSEAGTPFSGVLFAGLMLTDHGPKLIEYNCRFGDPECQVLMQRFKGDLVQLLHAVASGELAAAPKPVFDSDAALTVVIAAQGYPGSPAKGGAITISPTTSAKIFHAGTARDASGALIASGGRVLNVTACGPTITIAQSNAYEAIDAVTFSSGFYRRDIGWRAVERER